MHIGYCAYLYCKRKTCYGGKGTRSLRCILRHRAQSERRTSLPAKDIEAADVVIIAADIKVGGKDRFKGKKIVEVPTHIAIKSPKALINKIQEELGK